jgi:hypothetical protein
MAKEDKVVVLENVGGIDEDIHRLNGNLKTNLSNVEIDELHL